MSIINAIGTAVFKFISIVVIPAVHIFIQDFTRSMWPSSGREVLENEL